MGMEVVMSPTPEDLRSVFLIVCGLLLLFRSEWVEENVFKIPYRVNPVLYYLPHRLGGALIFLLGLHHFFLSL